MRILALIGPGAGFLSAVFLLTGCGGNGDTFSAVPTSARSSLSTRFGGDSKLSGEQFSSGKATSSCSSYTGKFAASGKATGPLAGTFTVAGEVKIENEEFFFDEHFEIRYGSKAISGTAVTQNGDSGSPVYACSDKKKLNFDAPILHYRERRSKVSGTGSASLTGTRFSQGFE